MVVAITVAIAFVSAFRPAGAATGARSCDADRGRVLVLTKTGRITSVPDVEGVRWWYACLHRNGRRVGLGFNEPDPLGAEHLSHPRLAGSYAAVAEYLRSTLTPGPDAILVDLNSRRRWEMPVPGDVDGMVLSQRGHLVVANHDSVLHLRRGGARATLDSGDIGGNSLAVSRDGRYVYWQNAGQPRVFELPR
jgi:hypothetical protein